MSRTSAPATRGLSGAAIRGGGWRARRCAARRARGPGPVAVVGRAARRVLSSLACWARASASATPLISRTRDSATRDGMGGPAGHDEVMASGITPRIATSACSRAATDARRRSRARVSASSTWRSAAPAPLRPRQRGFNACHLPAQLCAGALRPAGPKLGQGAGRLPSLVGEALASPQHTRNFLQLVGFRVTGSSRAIWARATSASRASSWATSARAARRTASASATATAARRKASRRRRSGPAGCARLPGATRQNRVALLPDAAPPWRRRARQDTDGTQRPAYSFRAGGEALTTARRGCTQGRSAVPSSSHRFAMGTV